MKNENRITVKELTSLPEKMKKLLSGSNGKLKRHEYINEYQKLAFE